MVQDEGCRWTGRLGGTVTLARSRPQLAPGRRRGRPGPAVRLRPGRPAAARQRSRRAGCWPAATCSAAPSPRTARPSTRPSWSARWPDWSAASVSPIYERTAGQRDRTGPGAHRATGPAGRPDRPGHRGFHPDLARASTHGRAGVLADDRHRAAARADLAADRAGRAADLHRQPAPDHLRPAQRRRPAGVRRPGRAVPPRLPDQARLRPGAGGVRRRWPDAGRPAAGRGGRPDHATAGVARWASPGTGIPRSAWTDPPGWPGPAATSAMGCPPRTWPAGRWPTCCCAGTPSSTTLPWVNHRSPAWEVEPLRWLGANAGLRAMTWADHAEQRFGRPSLLAGAVNRMMGR